MLDGNLYIPDPNQVGFVDYTNADYRLAPQSVAAGVGEDLSHIFNFDFDATWFDLGLQLEPMLETCS